MERVADPHLPCLLITITVMQGTANDKPYIKVKTLLCYLFNIEDCNSKLATQFWFTHETVFTKFNKSIQIRIQLYKC